MFRNIICKPRKKIKPVTIQLLLGKTKAAAQPKQTAQQHFDKNVLTLSAIRC